MNDTPTADYDRAAEACDGSRYCASDLHWHGCYADADGTACTEPADHPASVPVIASAVDQGDE